MIAVYLVDWVDKLHCVTTESAEASEGRNFELQQNLVDDFHGEPVKLTGGKPGGDGHANVLTIGERAADFEPRIVQGSVGVMLCPA